MRSTHMMPSKANKFSIWLFSLHSKRHLRRNIIYLIWCGCDIQRTAPNTPAQNAFVCFLLLVFKLFSKSRMAIVSEAEGIWAYERVRCVSICICKMWRSCGWSFEVLMNAYRNRSTNNMPSTSNDTPYFRLGNPTNHPYRGRPISANTNNILYEIKK